MNGYQRNNSVGARLVGYFIALMIFVMIIPILILAYSVLILFDLIRINGNWKYLPNRIKYFVISIFSSFVIILIIIVVMGFVSNWNSEGMEENENIIFPIAMVGFAFIVLNITCLCFYNKFFFDKWIGLQISQRSDFIDNRIMQLKEFQDGNTFEQQG